MSPGLSLVPPPLNQYFDDEKLVEFFLLMLNKMHTLKHPRVFASHGMLPLLIRISKTYDDNKQVGAGYHTLQWAFTPFRARSQAPPSSPINRLA